MEILIVGDTDGDLKFAKTMNALARRNDIQQIVQLGDFGYWPTFSWFHEKLDTDNQRSGTKWAFLPGNHEDWDALEKTTDWPDTVQYLGKTGVFSWDGVTFYVAGGAYSIDKWGRTVGIDWFPQETLKEGDLIEIEKIRAKNQTADVLLTHDGPTWGEYGDLFPIPESHQHRQIMDVVHNISRPKLWFHGHYHRWLNYTGFGTEVYGLDCNYASKQGMFPSAVMLSLPSLKVSRFEWGEVYDNKW